MWSSFLMCGMDSAGSVCNQMTGSCERGDKSWSCTTIANRRTCSLTYGFIWWHCQESKQQWHLVHCVHIIPEMTNRKLASDRSDSDIHSVVQTAVQKQKEFDLHMQLYRSSNQVLIDMLQLIADPGEFLSAPLQQVPLLFIFVEHWKKDFLCGPAHFFTTTPAPSRKKLR